MGRCSQKIFEEIVLTKVAGLINLYGYDAVHPVVEKAIEGLEKEIATKKYGGLEFVQSLKPNVLRRINSVKINGEVSGCDLVRFSILRSNFITPP